MFPKKLLERLFSALRNQLPRENNVCLGRVKKIEKSMGIFPSSDKNCFVPDFYLALKSSIFYTRPFYPVLLYHELVGAIRIAPNCQNSPILSKNIVVGTTTFNFTSRSYSFRITRLFFIFLIAFVRKYYRESR